MPAVKGVGEPCAGEPHARIDAAAGGIWRSVGYAARTLAPPADPTASGLSGETSKAARFVRAAAGRVARSRRPAACAGGCAEREHAMDDYSAARALSTSSTPRTSRTAPKVVYSSSMF